ncbi:EI24 domain-containing protein [Kiloniella majae]|uniref:EI24 domain-containing protein n=1 Tax=Kiloniella majae TaxID=1938558 RepID=UPI000A2770BA|nr:EI24 domain-containing protein [Kiloniella majae]
MFSDLSKAFGQTGDPAFRKVFFISTAISLVIFALLWGLAGYGVSFLDGLIASWAESDGWFTDTLVTVAEAVSWLGVAALSLILFPSVMLIILPFFLEDIAKAVEAKFYPELGEGRQPPIGETILGSISFVGVTILVNIIALPLYILFLFIPPLNFVLFYLINGYLLGREYFEMVAQRRMVLKDAKVMRKANSGKVLMSGFFLAFLLTVPILNIAMPIWATAFMLHRFERIRRAVA